MTGGRDAVSDLDSPSPVQPAGRRKRRPLRDRRWVRIVLTLFVVFTLWISWSVGHALTVPGGGTVSERLAEWARDHYLGPVVTLGEYLTYKPPKVGGKPSFALTGPSAGPVRVQKPSAQKTVVYGPPPALKPLVANPLPGEGSWRVLGTAGGQPAIFGTYLRASSIYTSYVAGIVSMNQNLVSFQLRPGTEDPGPGNWNASADIAPGARLGLLATFNGGFKISSSGGGFYLNGVTKGTLTNGTASAVYYRNGRIAIGAWGSTMRMTPDVVGVRQNLRLILQNGAVPSSVDFNVESSWGATLGGGYYVWRSGMGITPDGRIIYVYGPSLNVRELADLLKQAGAVTAMELDINPDWMSYMYYLPGHNPSDPTPVNLLPDQLQPADRYYSPANRDFTAVYAR
jgi:Phosphodiester glycosidase